MRKKTLFLTLIAGAVLCADTVWADAICRCERMNAESQSSGTCVRTEILDGCSMVWTVAPNQQLGQATDEAVEDFNEDAERIGFQPLVLDGSTDLPPSRRTFENLDRLAPVEYPPTILDSYLAILGGALRLLGLEGWATPLLELRSKEAEVLNSALRNSDQQVSRETSRFTLSASAGCLRVNIPEREATILIKTGFANAETCR